MAECLRQNMAENEGAIQPMHINDILYNERMFIESAKAMPRWLKQTLQDTKLGAPLVGRTRSSSRNASSNFVDYSLIATTCNEY